MNIFVLSLNHAENASFYSDKHVSKMLLEACQLLCTTHHLTGTDPSEIPYKKTHPNHPCSIWTRESLGNYIWLVELANSLSREYEIRFGKTHGCKRVVEWCFTNFPKIEKKEITDFAIAINHEKFPGCKMDNALDSYREYYKKYKQGFMMRGKFIPHKWTVRNKPEFML